MLMNVPLGITTVVPMPYATTPRDRTIAHAGLVIGEMERRALERVARYVRCTFAHLLVICNVSKRKNIVTYM